MKRLQIDNQLENESAQGMENESPQERYQTSNFGRKIKLPLRYVSIFEGKML